MSHHVIHIFGASGSGTTTLARCIAERWGFVHLDSDDFFWLPTDPPYTHKRPIDERVPLMRAQIERADTVVSVTNDDNTNIMVAQIARNVYHIPNVICRLYDPEREIVYKEFGIDTICPTVLSTREIDRLLGKAKGEKEA